MGETVETIKVLRDGFDYVIINRSDFDPTKHVIYRERLKASPPAQSLTATLPDVALCAVKHMGNGRYAILYDGKELSYARTLSRADAKRFEDLSMVDKLEFLRLRREPPGT